MKLDELYNFKSMNCTREFLNQLAKLKLDYDPFLNAQDCIKAWLKTLTTTRIKNIKLGFKVTYKEAQFEEIPPIQLTLIDYEDIF